MLTVIICPLAVAVVTNLEHDTVGEPMAERQRSTSTEISISKKSNNNKKMPKC